MERIRLKIERVTFASPETGFVVIKGRFRRRKTTAVGILTDAIMKPNLVGTEYELSGRWEKSGKYGRQFSFKEARLVTDPLFYFLAKIVKGLGESLSRRLMDHYGSKRLVEILDNNPQKLLEFKGIKEKKLKQITDSWKKEKTLKALSELLLPHGVTPNLLVRIHNHFGEEAKKKIQENPYLLTEVRGIGFKTADSIAMKLGTEPDSVFRIQSAIKHVLLDAAENEGHTYLPPKSLLDRTQEILGDEKPVLRELISSVLSDVALSGGVYRNEEKVALPALKRMESYLASFFKKKASAAFLPIADRKRVESFVAEQEKKENINFSEEQKRIIMQIGTLSSRVFALSGYAGTGKSTVSRTILKFLEENFCERKKIVCCAFTGMASARIRKLTGYPSYTIHTLLKYKGNNEFEYGREKRLPHRVILLDEASMVNLMLFYRLALAIRDDAVFIMVGDPAQLPPIGAGNVFGDMIKKRFMPATFLTSIFRQSRESVLVYFANIIRTGKVPEGYTDRFKDFAFHTRDIKDYFTLKRELSEAEIKEIRDQNNERILKAILQVATKAAKHLKNPVWEFQVLSPMRKGMLGTETLNFRLQEIFNGRTRGEVNRFGITIKERDKVVHLQNMDMTTFRYDFRRAGWDDRSCEVKRIFNGTVGIVKRIDHDEENFYVLYPGGLVVMYEFDHIHDLVDLAYCLTVHKAQGSQYPMVVIPMSNSHYVMLDNKWLYTAITRAERKVILVGQHFAFKRACTNKQTAARMTFLSGWDV